MSLAPSPWEVAANLLDPPPHPYAGKPAEWASDRMGEYVTRKQRAIMESVRDNRYTAVPSHHAAGKSHTAANLVGWWIDSHPVGEAFVVTTAPTWAQVKAVLWRYIQQRWRKGGLPGRITDAAEWKLNMGDGPDELVAFGRKPADHDPAAFQGIHARYVLVVIDEAGGVPKALWDAIDSLVTNDDCRVLAIGNPDDPGSHFAAVCQPGSGWNVIPLDALEAPSFTKDEVAKYPRLQRYMIQEGIAPSTERIPDRLRPLLVSPLWVDERLARWGASSPLFQAKVRGRFPSVTKDTVINPHHLKLAQLREQAPDPTDPRLAVDVARYGTDWSVIALRLGPWIRILDAIASGPVTELAGKVTAWFWWEDGPGGTKERPLKPIVNVDDVGVGGGVTDILLGNGVTVLPLLAGVAGVERLPNGRPRFVNARSEWWWTMREALAGPSGTGEDSWLDLDPDDDELAAQLLAPRYRLNRHGQIEVESKDQLKARGVDSPDRADAVIMSLVLEANVPKAQEQAMMNADLMAKDVW